MAVQVHVVSDLICPWCYVGKRRMERAIAELGEAVELVWHPFQLNPDMPREGMERAQYRTLKFGSLERSHQLDAQVSEAAAGEGLAFRYDLQKRTPNTFDGHRVVALALKHGRQDAVVEALFQAYFAQGRDVGDHATLVEIAEAAGLDGAEVAAMLATDALAPEVAGNDTAAREAGVSGVPTFILGNRGISGAHDPATLVRFLKLAAASADEEAVLQ